MESVEQLRLEPFIHQVGGHSPLFCLDQITVCKPFEQREHNFYRTLPDCLQVYTPSFKGAMQVEITEDSEGYIILKGYPPETYRITCGNHVIGKPKLRLKRCEGIEIESEIPGDHQYFEDEREKGKERTYNPWALKCHRENLRKMGIRLGPAPDSPLPVTSHSQQYILLENITSKYQHPCVLDLKVGTRQYGDNATATKKQSKNAKVNASTSGILGLRLGGMQVYQVNLGRYICRNKNYGRNISTDGFKMAIKQFLSNGHVLRTDVIRGLVRKITDLKEVVTKLDSFRFYTSSLLITYDGNLEKSGAKHRCCGMEKNYRPRNSLSTSSLLLMSQKTERTPSITRAESARELSGVDTDWQDGGEARLRKRSLSYENLTRVESGKMKTVDLFDFVDVRIIDFAHSTHRGLRDSTLHVGPDKGFLFGLENFIKLLKEIELNARCSTSVMV